MEKGHFLCGDKKTCIPLTQVCDKLSQCPDQSDEGANCHLMNCTTKKCSHACAGLPTGPQCYCPNGQKLVGETDCVDVDECQTYGMKFFLLIFHVFQVIFGGYGKNYMSPHIP